jgi:alpha-glucoside transport system substrate-binding protein
MSRRPRDRDRGSRQPDPGPSLPTIDRLVSAVRTDIPPLPPGTDERVLAAIRRESATGAAPRDTRRRIRPPGLWMAVGPILAFVVVVAFLTVGPARQPATASGRVPALAFTPRCDSTSGQTRVDGRQRADGEQRLRGRIVVAGPWRGKEAIPFRTLLTRFSERTGVRVIYAYKTREIAETLRTRLSLECPPDVAVLPQPGLVRDLATEGHLRAIKTSTKQLVSRNLGPFWRKLGSVDGTLYGVWFKAANKSTFWYSRRLYDAAGVTPPATWAKLRTTAARLRAHETVPFSVAGADGWTLTDWFENVYLQTAGPARYDALARHRLAWTDATVVAALRRLAEIFGHTEWLAGGGSAELMKTNFEQSVRQVFSARPSAAMVYEGDFVASQIPADHADDAGVFAFPSVTGTQRPVVVGGDVATLLTNNEDGQRLVRFLATVKAARIWARSGGISPNRRLDPRAYRNPLTRRLARTLTHATVKRFDLSDLQPPAFGATPAQGMRQILRDYLSEADDIRTVTRHLEAAAKATRACERAVAGEC